MILGGISQTGHMARWGGEEKAKADLRRSVEPLVKYDIDLIICEVRTHRKSYFFATPRPSCVSPLREYIKKSATGLGGGAEGT